jgi:hypothetical protein
MSFVVLVVSGHSRVDKVRVFNGNVRFLLAGQSILGVDLGLVACWLGLKAYRDLMIATKNKEFSKKIQIANHLSLKCLNFFLLEHLLGGSSSGLCSFKSSSLGFGFSLFGLGDGFRVGFEHVVFFLCQERQIDSVA